LKNVRKERHRFYWFWKILSLAIRFVICYFTIETVPIFSDEIFNEFWGQVVPIYSILLFIGRRITRLFYDKRYDSPYKGLTIYFIVHVILALVLWGVLAILTAQGKLPIS